MTQDLIDFAGISQEERSHDSRVDQHGAVIFDWNEAPDQEQNLRQPVEWEPAEDDVGEEFDNREGGEHHPVGQPLRVVLLS